MTLSLWVTLFQFYFISSLSISRNQLADSWKWQKTKESSEAKVGHKLGWFMVVFSVICISFPMIQNTLRGLSLFTAPSSQQEFGVYWADKGFLSSAPLPKVILLSVTELPWAVSLLPTSSKLTDRVTYYEKLARGWKIYNLQPQSS